VHCMASARSARLTYTPALAISLSLSLFPLAATASNRRSASSTALGMAMTARSIARAPKVSLRALIMFMTARGFLGSSQQGRRLWQVDTRTGQLWHASLADTHTGEPKGFADWQSLFAFLEEQTNDSDRRSNVDST
jgi:hypothetical protein